MLFSKQLLSISAQCAIVKGEVLTRMITCVVLSSEYVIKIANKLG